jgi:CelD/BcsL family acetyltransferase involved in cellulose biosynthesis
VRVCETTFHTYVGSAPLGVTDPARLVRTLAPHELTEGDRSAWADLQRQNPLFDSAFFSPDFTELIGSVREDVEVAVMHEAEQVVGFFPFLRTKSNTARPVAGRLTEFQGPICRGELAWEPSALMRMSRLRAWYFDHLPMSHPSLACHAWGTVPLPCIHMDGGFPHYEDQVHRRGRTIEQIHRKARKLAREVGPLRFELHTHEERVFATLLQWKSEQHRRRDQAQILTYPWILALLERVRCHSSDRMNGVLSALWAGDQLAAVHLGLRTPRVLHVWFPTYNRALEQHSPGLIMLLHMAKHAAADGVTRIDLGTGDERYKQQLKTGDIPLLVGGVDLRMGRKALRRNWYALNQWVRRSPYREYLEIPLNTTRRYRQWLGFR